MMIYNIYGFSFKSNLLIKKYQNFVSDYLNDRMPVINICEKNKLDFKMEENIEIKNDFYFCKHSINKSYFLFHDGESIMITPNEIQFAKGKFDERLIGGGEIIILSRQHSRAILHGSAFLYGGKAYLLCAYPGAGKSTMTAAMSKYHKNIMVLTDDIICLENDGKSICRGLSQISLNKDSYLFLQSKEEPYAFIPANSKTIFETTTDYNSMEDFFQIGGIFFIQKPLDDGLIQIEKLSKLNLFYETVKNIKTRNLLIGKQLNQELQIISRLTNNNIFGVKLRIKHEYSKLQEITNRILDFIDEQEKK